MGINDGVPYDEGEVYLYEDLPGNIFRWCADDFCEDFTYSFAGKKSDIYKRDHTESLMLTYARQNNNVPDKSECFEHTMILVK